MRGPKTRIHIVFVPGFSGFDALGQMLYYPHALDDFKEWQAQCSIPSQQRPKMELHFFPNLPTAGVATRARRLLVYVVGLMSRGIVREEEGDEIFLIGHSTGGLDMRSFVWDLIIDPDRKIGRDGETVPKLDPLKLPKEAPPIVARNILKTINGLVFLSVPQAGTNIAEWVSEHGPARTAVFDILPFLAAGWVSTLPTGLSSTILKLITGGDFGLALADVVNETNPNFEGIKGNSYNEAGALEARSKLNLYLSNMRLDFGAISDLRPVTTDAHDRTFHSRFATMTTHRMQMNAPQRDELGATPARWSDARRIEEVRRWKQHKIGFVSFASVGNRPPDIVKAFPPGGAAPEWKLYNPLALLRLPKQGGFDSAYRAGYMATAGGEFYYLPAGVREMNAATPNTPSAMEHYQLEMWDNDGIVNTASQLWPNLPGNTDEANPPTRLVRCDHADIIGHFSLVDNPSAADTGRKYLAYDIFGSRGPLDSEHFPKYGMDESRKQVWFPIFQWIATGRM